MRTLGCWFFSTFFLLDSTFLLDSILDTSSLSTYNLFMHSPASKWVNRIQRDKYLTSVKFGSWTWNLVLRSPRPWPLSHLIFFSHIYVIIISNSSQNYGFIIYLQKAESFDSGDPEGQGQENLYTAPCKGCCGMGGDQDHLSETWHLHPWVARLMKHTQLNAN